MKRSRVIAGLADHAVGVAAAVVVLAPLATVTMALRTGLVVRASFQLAVTLAALLVSLRGCTPRDTLAAVRRPILVGLALHLAATALGTVVALARGNDPVRLAGQLLAFGLLPLAAATLVGTARVERWRSLAVGLATAFTLGAAVQIVAARIVQRGPITGLRFVLPNAVSLAPCAALVLALAVCLLRDRRHATRSLGWAAVLLAVLLVALTRNRTYLVGVPIAAVILAAVALARGRRPLAWAGAGAAAATALVLLAPAAAWVWWHAPRAPLPIESVVRGLPGGPPRRPGVARPPRPFIRLATMVAPQGDLVRVTGHAVCESDSWLKIRLHRLQAGPVLPPAARLAVLPLEGVPFAFTLLAPGDGTRLALEASRNDGPPCRLIDVASERLGPAALAPVVTSLWTALRREPDPDPEAEPYVPVDDASLAFRLKEARELVTEIRGGSGAELLFGRGLGATFHLATSGFDSSGRVVPFGETNFIHNLYLFLLFKLGVVGTVLILAALALWVVETVRIALVFAPASAERLFAAGAAAVWLSYAVMGLAAPHLISFELASIFGFVLAATARLAPRSKPERGRAGAQL